MRNTRSILQKYPLICSALMAISGTDDPEWVVRVVAAAKMGGAMEKDLVAEAIQKRHQYNASAATREISLALCSTNTLPNQVGM